MDSIKIIEPIAYIYPHKQELVATSKEMVGVWSLARKFAKDGGFFAPLLVDDLRREGFITYQTVDEILEKTIGASYPELPWFGEQVAESDIFKQYGNLGCKTFDQIYHRDVLLPIMAFGSWEWHVVHPGSFMGQQAGMLEGLFKLIYGNVNFNVIAKLEQVKTEDVRNRVRDEFYGHFWHHWIGADGNRTDVTNPVYEKKQVVFKTIL